MFRKILGLSLLVVAAPALAADLSYNYVQLSYQFVEIDDDLVGVDIDGDGPAIGGSLEVAENWFVTAGYSTFDLDFGVDVDQLSVGFGYHVSISENADAFATLSYVNAEVSASGFPSVDEDGYGFTVGLRGMVSDKVELSGALAYVDLGDGGDDTTVGAMAVYNFTDNFGLGVGAEFDDDATVFGIGARFYFGN